MSRPLTITTGCWGGSIGAPPSELFGACPPAPILTLADVLEPELCRHLVDCFERGGGRESGFMQDVEGRSVEHFDDGWKRRRDFR